MFVAAEDPPSRLVMEIMSGLPFGGTWTYRVEQEGAGARVTITEDGKVYGPLLRDGRVGRDPTDP